MAVQLLGEPARLLRGVPAVDEVRFAASKAMAATFSAEVRRGITAMKRRPSSRAK